MKQSIFLSPFRRGVGRKIFVLFLLAGVIPLLFTAWLASHKMQSEAQERAYESLHRSAKSQAYGVLSRLTQIERAARQIHAQRSRGADREAWARELSTDYFGAVAFLERSGGLTILVGGFSPTSLPEFPVNVPGRRSVLRTLPSGTLEMLVKADSGGDWLVGRIKPDAVWPNNELLPAKTDICVFETGRSAPLFCGGEGNADRRMAIDERSSGQLISVGDGPDASLAVSWQLFLGSRFQSTPLEFVALQKKSVAMRSSADFHRVFLAAFFAVLLLIGFLSFKAIGQNLVPLQRLTRAARAFATGDRKSRVSIKTGDEFENLGDIFNAMADRLGSQIAVLESVSAIDRLILSGADVRDVCLSVCQQLQDLAGCHCTAAVALTKLSSNPQRYLAIRSGDDEKATRLCDVFVNFASGTKTVKTSELSIKEIEDEFETAGASHAAVVPMRLNDTVFGQLYIGGDRPDFLSESTIRELESIAERLAVALGALDREDELHRRANFDDLTGLPNRQSSKERLANLLHSGREGAVLFLDLDHFKKINDVYGHSVGDIVLRQVAERIRITISRYDFVARIGGDEFVVILDRVLDHAQVSQIAKNLIAKLTEVYSVFDVEHYLGATIGIVTVPEDGNSVEVLMRNADAAMYRAKEAGRATYEFFNAELNADGRRKVELEKGLRKAIENDGLSLVYQPQFSTVDYSLCGVEALLRWKHPTLGHISPAEFIPLAEQSELIEEVGNWVIDKACAEIAQLLEHGLNLQEVSLNVSARQLRHVQFSDRLLETVSNHGLPHEIITIEVTESTLAHNKDLVLELLQNLRASGMRVAIDDFGTGYSSLSYLQNLPFDVVKIDKSFVDRIDEEDSSANICTTIVKMAHELGKSVVAEGVETKSQLKFLKDNHCEVIQGYILSRPLAYDDLVVLMRELDTLTQRRRTLKIL